MDPNLQNTEDRLTHLPTLPIYRREKIDGLAASQTLFQELRNGTIPTWGANEQTEMDDMGASEDSASESFKNNGGTGNAHQRCPRREVYGGVRLAGWRPRKGVDVMDPNDPDFDRVSNASTLPPPYSSTTSSDFGDTW